MSNPLRAPRGTTTSITSRVLLDGEMAYDTTLDKLRVGDGATYGGRVFGENEIAVINVTEYGALGDGSTDDRTAILAAIAAANPGVVYFPPGTYMVSESLTGITAGTHFVGAGMGSTKIKLVASTDATIFGVDCNDVGFSDMTIEGSFIDGTYEPVSTSALILLNPPTPTVTMTIASPCVVSRTAHGLAADDPVSFTTTGALPTGITASQVYYVISAGLGADSFRISATLGGSAVNTSGSQSGTHSMTTPVRRFSLRNLRFKSAIGGGLVMSGGVENVTAVGLEFELCRRYGISAFKGLKYSSFTGMRFYQCGSAIQFDDATASDTSTTSRPCDGIAMSDVVIRACGSANVGSGEAMLGASGLKNASFTNVWIYDVGFADPASGQDHWGALFNSGQDEFNRCANIELRNFNIIGGYSGGIKIQGVKGFRYIGGTLENFFKRGSDPGTGYAALYLYDDDTPSGCEDVYLEGIRFPAPASGYYNDCALIDESDNGSNIEVGPGCFYGSGITKFINNATYPASGSGTARNRTLMNRSRPLFITLADDAAVSLGPIEFGFAKVKVTGHSTSAFDGEALVRRDVSLTAAKKDGEADFAATTNAGVPTGTTSTDAKVTIIVNTSAAATADFVYLENRAGAALSFLVEIVGMA